MSKGYNISNRASVSKTEVWQTVRSQRQRARFIPAQGSALGQPSSRHKALKARRLISPLVACFMNRAFSAYICMAFPRAVPWAGMNCADGAGISDALSNMDQCMNLLP
jgi:hypothetical protein